MQCSFREEKKLGDGSWSTSECVNKADVFIENDSCYGLCYACACKRLKAENKEMRDWILNEARHSAGCSRDIGEEYRCRCGLADFQQALESEAKE